MMKKIGITQRVDYFPDRGERRDALDQKWSEFLWNIGLISVPLSAVGGPYETYLSALELDGFILSGGNDIGEAPERDALEDAVLSLASKERVPVVGVCRGMEFMNTFLGGSLREVSGHVATTHALEGDFAEQNALIEVNSFHDMGIEREDLSGDLRAIAFSKDGIVEAVRHHTYPWLGVMWHPERNQPFRQQDLKIFSQWFGASK